jgi:hypothetical protein
MRQERRDFIKQVTVLAAVGLPVLSTARPRAATAYDPSAKFDIT